MRERLTKQARRVRRIAKKLLKAVRADVRAHVKRHGGPHTEPPAQMLFSLGVGALMGAAHKRTCPASRMPTPFGLPIPVLGAAESLAAAPIMRTGEATARQQGRINGNIDMTDPSPGVRDIALQTFGNALTAILADAGDDQDERARRAAGFAHGVMQAVVGLVWPHAIARTSDTQLKENLHIVLGDAIAAHVSSAAPSPSAARGPGGGQAGAA
jgi:hypothetical protein